MLGSSRPSSAQKPTATSTAGSVKIVTKKDKTTFQFKVKTDENV
jgi:hypothetical protein